MNWITRLYFTYWWRSFWCSEMTVWDYYLYLKDPEYLIEKKLDESWKKHNLSDVQLRRFIRILLDWKDEDDIINKLWKKKNGDKTKKTLDDLHIFIGLVNTIIHTDSMNMPLEMFWKILKDISIISLKENYDPDRNDKTIDSKALMNFTGWKKRI